MLSRDNAPHTSAPSSGRAGYWIEVQRGLLGLVESQGVAGMASQLAHGPLLAWMVMDWRMMPRCQALRACPS